MKGYRIINENFVRVKYEYNKSWSYGLEIQFNLYYNLKQDVKVPLFYYYYYFLWEKIKSIGKSYRFNSYGVPLIFEYSLVTTVAAHLYVNYLW